MTGQTLTVEHRSSNEARKAGSLLLEALNTGDLAKQTVFLEASLSEEALKGRGAKERAQLLHRAWQQSQGPIQLVSIVEVALDLVEFHVKTNRGEHLAKIYVFLDKSQPGKIRDFGFVPKPSEEFTRQDEWPTTQFSGQDHVISEIAQHVDLHARQDVFSGVVMVAKNDKVIFQRSVGLAERSFGVPNNVETKFHLGSMNKMFTSLGIAQLIQQNRLSFETRLIEVIPDYPNRTAAEKITIQQLLTHNAGLGSLFDRPRYDRREKYANMTAYFKVFSQEPLIFEPGTNHSYSNEGYIVLGAIIERVTGQDYHDYVRQNIFHPAGMMDTDAYALDEVTPNLAVGYARFEDDPFGVDPRRPNWMFLGWRGNSCGGGYSTGPDLLRFAKALKEHRFVDRDLTEKLTSQQSPKRKYGMGFEVEHQNGRIVVGHGGGGPNSGINSHLSIFLDGSYTVAVLGNYDAPAASNLARGITGFLAYQ